MSFLIALLLFISPIDDVHKIARVNTLKKEAEKAYLSGDFKTAYLKYATLTDSFNVKDDAIQLNLSHCQYKLGNMEEATAQYDKLKLSQNDRLRSTAYLQLGNIAASKKKLEEALNHYKSSLKANPANEEARYNYEMVKKMLKKQPPQDQEQKNKDQKDDQQQKDQNQENKNKEKDKSQKENGDQNKKKQDEEEGKKEQKEDKTKEEQNKEDKKNQEENSEDQKNEQAEKGDDKKEKSEAVEEKPGEGEEDSKETSDNQLKERLQQMNMSEEKAKMILESLKNREIQYYQQQRKTPAKRPDHNKPDW